MLVLNKTNDQEELPLSLCASSVDHANKNCSGLALVECDQNGQHIITIRTIQKGELKPLTSMDQDKPEISLSSFFLPPGTEIQKKIDMNVNITAKLDPTEWKFFNITIKETTTVFLYHNITFPWIAIDEDKDINEENVPFKAWIEIDGAIEPPTGAKCGADY
jgi:hypothetical protein